MATINETPTARQERIEWFAGVFVSDPGTERTEVAYGQFASMFNTDPECPAPTYDEIMSVLCDCLNGVRRADGLCRVCRAACVEVK